MTGAAWGADFGVPGRLFLLVGAGEWGDLEPTGGFFVGWFGGVLGDSWD